MAEYFYIIDYIEAFLWTITYVLVALVGLVNKDDTRLAMPKIALMANFAWEVASLFELGGAFSQQGGYIRIVWFISDIFILLAVFIKNYKLPKFSIRCIGWIIPWIVLTFVFYIGPVTGELFLPVSAFVIDVEMAILFWAQRKKFDPSMRVYIAVTKLFGDILAGVYCSPIHYSIIVLASISLVFNILYLIFAVKEYKANLHINDAFKENFQELLKKLKSRRFKTNKYQKTRTYKKKKRVKKTHRKKH